MLALREEPVYGRVQSAIEAVAFGGVRPPITPASASRDGASASLAALAGDALDARFRNWIGASGRRYVFSVYDRRSCPAYEHAVMMIATLAPDGGRRVIFIGDTGCFPDIMFANAERDNQQESEIEFHIHLLATTRAERVAVMADLSHAWRS